MITSKDLQIFLLKMQKQEFQVKQDWAMYQLILFNIMQNAIKYNRNHGKIVVQLDFTPVDD